MLDLVFSNQISETTIHSIKLQKLSSFTSIFDINYEPTLIGKESKYYWRLVGINNNDLLSFSINNGLILNIELNCLKKTKIEESNHSYHLESNYMEALPCFDLLPSDDSFKVDVYKTMIDNYVNVSVLLFNNAIRLSWKLDAVFKTVLANNMIAFELSEKGQLIGVVVFQNMKDLIFSSDSIDQIIYKNIVLN